ncbi:MAG: ATP-binding cassette domain-containing protein [Myxococcales bacterium]|nr:ATP-binding cassette domain-containing protein [Myxococcales bacterium]MCB9578482.1 ATP-binding cassette domain-containing protein [Polyangiaceae bacterium]
MSVLAFESVRKTYGTKVALHGLSFEVNPGEVFGLLGPNGAGKTTALRVLMDIVRADSGKVTLFGQRLTRDALDRVGYLPEERGLYAKQKVVDVMAYFGALKGLRDIEQRARARLWLDKVGLRDHETSSVEQLSKGMSQKVQIAATLQTEPELCILDEPFSGLDPVNSALIRSLIAEVKASGRTTILSTHQMSMVETLCDRVAMLSSGRLVEYGSVSDVRHKHSLPEVRLELDQPLPELPGVERAVSEGATSYRLLLSEHTDAQQVLAELVKRNVGVRHFERVLAPMEDIFIRVVTEQTS